MKSIIQYGVFAGSLLAAVFVGHMLTKYSYEDRSEKIALQSSDNANAPVATALSSRLNSPELNNSTERNNSPERNHSPELNKSPEQNKNPEPSKNAEQAKNSGTRTNSVITLGSTPAPKAGKNQVAEKLALSPPSTSSKTASSAASSKTTLTSQNSPALDTLGSGRTVMDNFSDRGGAPQRPLSDNPGPNTDMLAMLSPLLKLSDAEPLGAESIEGKVLMVVLWAPWCAACREQLATMESVKNKVADPNLDIVVVVIDGNLDEARQAVLRKPMGYPTVIGTEELYQQLQSPGLPSTYLSDSRGRYRFGFKGYNGKNWPVYEQRVRAILAETKTRSEKPAAVVKLTEAEVGGRL